jgi:hypothetical protein
MTSDPQDEQTRAIVERRLMPKVLTDREEAQYYVRVLLARGFTLKLIAERCGVGRNAVSTWKFGIAAPGDESRFSRLALLTRAALQTLPPRRETLPEGMPKLVYALMRALDVSATEVARRVGIRWPQQTGPRWLWGGTRPFRLATLRLRTLAVRAGLCGADLAVRPAVDRDCRRPTTV